MAKIPFEFIDFKEETFSDYVSRYDIELSSFLSEFEDNTEALFVDDQINNFTYHKDELAEFIRNIDFSSESREEYLQFLKNRVGYFNDKNDKNDNEIELFESDKYKEYSYYYNFLKNRRASVFKILEFLKNKKEPITFDQKENGNISKSTSNDKNNDFTKKAWFIVGKNIANGKIQELVNKKLSKGKIAEELGLKYSDAPHISKSMLFRPCRDEKSRNNIFNYPEKITEIYNHCINNGITVVPEFEEIALKTPHIK